MEISVDIPTDESGFMRRECPNCKRQFKWFLGASANRPEDFLDPELYYCPYCGEAAPHNAWWTKEQIEYAEAMAAGPAMKMASRELEKTLRGMKGLKFSPNRNMRGPEPPLPMIESDDMTMVASPCHDFEPVKIAEDWVDPVHCLICGGTYSV